MSPLNLRNATSYFIYPCVRIKINTSVYAPMLQLYIYIVLFRKENFHIFARMLPERDDLASDFSDKDKLDNFLIKIHNILDICTLAKQSVIFNCEQKKKNGKKCEHRKYATAFEMVIKSALELEEDFRELEEERKEATIPPTT